VAIRFKGAAGFVRPRLSERQKPMWFFDAMGKDLRKHTPEALNVLKISLAPGRGLWYHPAGTIWWTEGKAWAR
jgi:hypothetical protein